ncbi:MAG: hypothetical protein LUP94_02500 [Candidatus Methanomethylicus sp.]|nr:hypothetical protein [Candidatus Methanomethylicus sp.]
MSQSQAAQEMPRWMPSKTQEEIKNLEAKRAHEKFRHSLKEQLVSLKYIRSNKRMWHAMPFFLMHMLACSYADISSIELVRASSRTEFGEITKLMRKITAMLNLGIDLSRACEITRKDAKLLYLQDFLQRFAQIAKLGEDMIVFLGKEYNTFMTMYSSDMERAFIRFKRFTEAYSAVLSSSVLIVMILTFTGLLWGSGMSMVGVIVPGIVVMYGMFALIFYISSPVIRVISLTKKRRQLLRLTKINRYVVWFTFLVNLVFVFLITLHIVPRDLGLLAAGLSGFPSLIIGFMGINASNRVETIDERFPEFATMLSTSLSTMGTSIIYAFRDVSRLDFGKLSPYVRGMSAKLELGIDKNVSWESFETETSSDMMRIHSEAFSKANAYGAPAKEFGPLVANSSLFMLTLRRRLSEVSALMKGIIIPMHPILCAIMGLIMAIITQFVEIFKTFQGSGMPVIFMVPDLNLIDVYIYLIVTALTFINALLIYEISGEQEFNLSFYLGLFVVSGWLTYLVCLTSVIGYLQGIGLGNLTTPTV